MKPNSFLIEEERSAYADLSCLLVRREQMVRRFQNEMIQIEDSIQQAQKKLIAVQEGLRSIAVRRELHRCPVGIQCYYQRCGPLPLSNEERLPNCWKAFDDMTVERSPPAPSHDERRSIEHRLHHGAIPLFSSESFFFDHRSFVPYVSSSGEVLHRKIHNDVLCMRSSETSMGRVLVTLRSLPAGGVVLAEVPWLFIPEGGDGAVLLPRLLRETCTAVMKQEEIFRAQGWDSRLVVPFLQYVASENSQLRELIQNGLCCPLTELPNAAVEQFAKFAKFLIAALPEAFRSMVPQSEAVRFLVAYTLNSVSTATQSGHEQSTALLEGSVFSCLSERSTSLFGVVSLLEHHCEPNAVLLFHRQGATDAPLVAEVRALRPLHAGERVSISYVNSFLPRAERRRNLLEKYHFSCECSRCSGADLLRAVVVDGAALAPIADGSMFSDCSVPPNTVSCSDPRLVATLARERSLLLRQSTLSDQSVMDVLGEVCSPTHAAWIALLRTWGGDVDKTALPSTELFQNACAVVANALLSVPVQSELWKAVQATCLHLGDAQSLNAAHLLTVAQRYVQNPDHTVSPFFPLLAVMLFELLFVIGIRCRVESMTLAHIAFCVVVLLRFHLPLTDSERCVAWQGEAIARGLDSK